MGLTSTLITGLSGLSANQSRLDVIGNNIANVNTVAFKSSSLDFKTEFSQTFSSGTQPNANLGGTNPLQVGLGVTDGAVSRNFSNGSLEVTGVNTNLAIQGNGYFVLQGTSQSFTRDGTFKLNSNNILVNGDGDRVQGFGVDSNYNVVPGSLTDLSVPIGQLSLANATTETQLQGTLDTSGTVATTVSDSTMNQPLYLAGAGAVNPTTAPAASDLLTNVTDATNVPLFQVGDVISATGKKGTNGGSAVATKTLTVTSATTLGDLATFYQGTLGINTTAGINGAATAPGVTVPATGNTATLTIDGNLGAANDLTLASNSLTINRSGTILSPFTFTKNASANGESITASFQAFDSLGATINTTVTATLTQTTSSGTIWTFTAESPDGTAAGAATNNAIGQGTLTFNNNGKLVATTGTTVNVDRAGTGAVPNQAFTLDFSGVGAFANTTSTLAESSQDGISHGTLSDFSIDGSGIIKGQFTNGQTRDLGQVALATFSNNAGLVDIGSNQFQPGPNSGTPIISAANQFSAGSIQAGSLELSNVDLSNEFVDLISASTGFSASSRVLTTSDQLMQELLQTAH